MTSSAVTSLHPAARPADEPAAPEPATPEPGRALTPEESIALLERTAGGPLRRYLTRLTGDFQRAEDIYQETLIRAWRHPEERDAEGRYGMQWLFTVARRISIDYLRAAAARPAEVSDGNMLARHGAEDSTDSVLAAHVVRSALGALSGEHRQVIYELYFLDRPAKEVAERHGIPVGTVKSRAHYALRMMRSALAEPAAAGPGLAAAA